MFKRTKIITILAFFLLLPFTSFAEEEESNEKRYILAKKAALRGQWTEFFELKQQLSDYPLQPYLEYFQITRNFNDINEATIHHYLNQYPNTPLAERLRRKWLQRLADSHQWDRYLKNYKSTDNTILKCEYIEALYHTGNTIKADEETRPLWLTGRDQPDECTIVFNTWLTQIPDKDEMLWERFSLALKENNFKLAKFLAERMSSSKQREAKAIITLYSNPMLVTKSSYLANQPSAEVISYGLFRVGRRHPDAAARLYKKLEPKYHFNREQKKRIFQAIALRYALRKQKASSIWYRKLIGYKLDPVYQDWMIRAALYNKDWLLVKDSIEGLPSGEKADPKWQYWYGRALDKLGEKAKAQQVYTELAKERNYYAFLASRKVHEKINVKHIELTVTPQEIANVQAIPAFKRAKILYHLNHKQDSSKELYYLIQHRDVKTQYIIIKLVNDWGWKSQALRLTRFMDHQDDITMRFPLRYKDTVTHHSKLRDINPALVYAIMRQESFFVPYANSVAGAVGLMQLMPATAYKTSKQFGLKYSGRQDLLDGTKNITLGCAHLKELHQKLKGHPVLMIAAYNAGRHNVLRWLPKDNKAVPADVWVETVPFRETRTYIKHVVAYHVVYQQRLGLEPNLDDIMKSVK